MKAISFGQRAGAPWMMLCAALIATFAGSQGVGGAADEHGERGAVSVKSADSRAQASLELMLFVHRGDLPPVSPAFRSAGKAMTAAQRPDCVLGHPFAPERAPCGG